MPNYYPLKKIECEYQSYSFENLRINCVKLALYEVFIPVGITKAELKNTLLIKKECLFFLAVFIFLISFLALASNNRKCSMLLFFFHRGWSVLEMIFSKDSRSCFKKGNEFYHLVKRKDNSSLNINVDDTRNINHCVWLLWKQIRNRLYWFSIIKSNALTRTRTSVIALITGVVHHWILFNWIYFSMDNNS